MKTTEFHATCEFGTGDDIASHHENEALATSAAYFSRSSVGGSGEASALVDARTGMSHLGDESFSVFASDCITKVLVFAEAAIAERTLASFDARARVLRVEH